MGSPWNGRLKGNEISRPPFSRPLCGLLDLLLRVPAVNCWAIIIWSANADLSPTISVYAPSVHPVQDERNVCCFARKRALTSKEQSSAINMSSLRDFFLYD